MRKQTVILMNIYFLNVANVNISIYYYFNIIILLTGKNENSLSPLKCFFIHSLDLLCQTVESYTNRNDQKGNSIFFFGALNIN